MDAGENLLNIIFSFKEVDQGVGFTRHGKPKPNYGLMQSMNPTGVAWATSWI